VCIFLGTGVDCRVKHWISPMITRSCARLMKVIRYSFVRRGPIHMWLGEAKGVEVFPHWLARARRKPGLGVMALADAALYVMLCALEVHAPLQMIQSLFTWSNGRMWASFRFDTRPYGNRAELGVLYAGYIMYCVLRLRLDRGVESVAVCTRLPRAWDSRLAANWVDSFWHIPMTNMCPWDACGAVTCRRSSASYPWIATRCRDVRGLEIDIPRSLYVPRRVWV